MKVYQPPVRPIFETYNRGLLVDALGVKLDSGAKTAEQRGLEIRVKVDRGTAKLFGAKRFLWRKEGRPYSLDEISAVIHDRKLNVDPELLVGDGGLRTGSSGSFYYWLGVEGRRYMLVFQKDTGDMFYTPECEIIYGIPGLIMDIKREAHKMGAEDLANVTRKLDWLSGFPRLQTGSESYIAAYERKLRSIHKFVCNQG